MKWIGQMGHGFVIVLTSNFMTLAATIPRPFV